MERGRNYLLELNQEFSRVFVEEGLLRAKVRAMMEELEAGWTLCMDGRLDPSGFTGTPRGVFRIWRNAGGRFESGWPHFQDNFSKWVFYAVGRGKNCVVFVTYHFSAGDPHRGCAGFEYNKEEAIRFTARLRSNLQETYGPTVVYPIQCGIETDLSALIFHGEKGKVLDCASLNGQSKDEILLMLKDLFPTIPDQVIRGILPFVQGNVAHVAENRRSHRPITQVVHHEWAIAVGSGLDWFREPNAAFIVGPYDPDLDGAIQIAARLLEKNIIEGRVDVSNGHRPVLLTCVPYRITTGPHQKIAADQALFLRNFALQAIHDAVPNLVSQLDVMAGTVDSNTRLFTPLD